MAEIFAVACRGCKELLPLVAYTRTGAETEIAANKEWGKHFDGWWHNECHKPPSGPPLPIGTPPLTTP